MKELVELQLSLIKPNPNQPRTVFDQDHIEELAQSIKVHGLIQPIVVRKVEDHYEIIAGERRFRACTLLRLEKVPVIIDQIDSEESAEVALIENIQRENLSVIEEAIGYKKLIEKYHISQSELAKSLGKSQSAIANKIRLLKLPEEVIQGLLDKKISERHGRALLKLTSPVAMIHLYHQIIEQSLNVAQTEAIVENNIHEQTPVAPLVKPKMGYIQDYRIATNQIKQSIKLIEQAGLTVNYDQTKGENDELIITITLKK